MAKIGDVTIKVTGLEGTTPIGVDISFPVGGIPTAIVDLAPGGPETIKIEGTASGVLANIDAEKRKKDITISVGVDVWASATNKKTHKSLKFVGLLDGLSISNSVGGTSYQAVIKNKAQILLELTTRTPGIDPAGIDPFKQSNFVNVDSSGDTESITGWNNLLDDAELDPTSVLTYYTSIIKEILNLQQGKYKEYIGREPLPDGSTPYEEIFDDPRYQKAIARGKEVFDAIDLDAASTGAISSIDAEEEPSNSAMHRILSQGPTSLLQNYQSFLNVIGCDLIFGNTKAFVIPYNSVIKQKTKAPKQAEMQGSKFNVAYPADYNSYIYNDNGYRDIASVIVERADYLSGGQQSGSFFDEGSAVHFKDKKNITQASGVHVVSAHVFMEQAPNRDDATTNKDASDQMDNGNKAKNLVDSKYSGYAGTIEKAKKATEEAEQKTAEDYQTFAEKMFKNYAETKFYQERYKDRTGSVTMDFNPNWVPGTSGTLYIRSSNMFLVFYVTSVRHRIDISPPNTGSATTTVTYSCGRMYTAGSECPGIDRDEYLGYDIKKEDAVKAKWYADIV